jgi:hypothetical protein
VIERKTQQGHSLSYPQLPWLLHQFGCWLHHSHFLEGEDHQDEDDVDELVERNSRGGTSLCFPNFL